ncbi:Uncharacterised protein [Mycobacteroides abscessus subsp. abscessus]|nr:Uncharacterised protein [Mycobacteroides abscessus subsp. abscessus]
MVSVATRPLPRKGSMMTGKTALLAASGLGESSPSATDNQARANTSRASRPNTASHSSGLACGRQPTRNATAIITTVPSMPSSTVPKTCPVSIDEGAIAMVRNRLTMPLVTSVETETATEAVR